MDRVQRSGLGLEALIPGPPGASEAADELGRGSLPERSTDSDTVDAANRVDGSDHHVHLWKGSENYEIVRRIGAGGMGVVYEAVDRRSNQRVALKALPEFDPAALYLLKQEFRVLA